MTGQSRLLAGIDLGPETVQVVSYAALFATSMHAAVRLLYVIDYLLTPPSYLAEYIEEEKKREEAEAAGWGARLQEAGVSAEYRIILGRLHESFLKVIEGTAPSLLVIGFKSHLFRPSSSERLIKSLKVPMLVVKGKAAEGAAIGSARVKRILCPVDFSGDSKKRRSPRDNMPLSFPPSCSLSTSFPHSVSKKRAVCGSDFEKRTCSHSIPRCRSEAESTLASFRKEMKIEGEGSIYEGLPGEVISSLAEEGSYDLIVLGARGLSFVESVVVGSTTEPSLNHPLILSLLSADADQDDTAPPWPPD